MAECALPGLEIAMRKNERSRLAVVTAAIFAFALSAPAQVSAQSYNRVSPNIGPRAPSISPVGPRIQHRFEPRIRQGTIDGATDPTPSVKHTKKVKKDPGGANQPAQSGGNSGPANARAVDNELVIEVSGAPSDQAANALAQRHGLARVQSQRIALTNTTWFRWRIADGGSMASKIRRLQADPSVLSVQRNYFFIANQGPGGVASEGDPAQYTLAKMHLPLAHGLARGDKVLVAVIDSGVDVNHPELAGVVAESFDALQDAEPAHSHGTAIAGAIAAHARLRGVAPAARILAVRAFGATAGSAEGTTFNVLRGLDWAVARGARIINMSFTGPNDPALRRALAAVARKGIVMIAAAGNAGAKSPPLYPAADPNVIAVTATDALDRLFAAANRGPYIAVAAPGVDILMPAPGASYQVSSGTSFAAAHVTGVAALILERKPDLSPNAVRNILIKTSRDLGPKGRDDQFGAGLIDAYKAVLSLGVQALETSANAPAR